MRIMWHAPAPWVRSGYGQQTGLWAPRLAELGHDVIISATHGIWGTSSEWQGIPVLPASSHKYGMDIIIARALREKADLVITLVDAWLLDSSRIKQLKCAQWMPVDCQPMGEMDRLELSQSKAIPIAMSEHGAEMMKHSGFDPLHVPHGIDTTVFKPSANRNFMRKELGVEDKFVIGTNVVNVDSVRKGMPEQLLAFAQLHAIYPDTVLLVHGQVWEASEPSALNMEKLITQLGLGTCVGFVNQYDHLVGSLGQDYLASWYNALDLYTSCSYAEGFGLTILEALACGIPCVVTDTSSMPEVAGPGGWVVGGEPFWNPRHAAWWAKPGVNEILAAYKEAYEQGPVYRKKKEAARSHALKYDADRVQEYYWKPALQEIETRI